MLFDIYPFLPNASLSLARLHAIEAILLLDRFAPRRSRIARGDRDIDDIIFEPRRRLAAIIATSRLAFARSWLDAFIMHAASRAWVCFAEYSRLF